MLLLGKRFPRLFLTSREFFVANQASAVLKNIVSQYPYEHLEDKSDSEEESHEEHEKPCLKTDAQVITDHLVRTLQRRVEIAGAKVDSFRFNEISYAPEIAQGMLKKQQAEAIVQSRSTLVRGLWWFYLKLTVQVPFLLPPLPCPD